MSTFKINKQSYNPETDADGMAKFNLLDFVTNQVDKKTVDANSPYNLGANSLISMGTCSDECKVCDGTEGSCSNPNCCGKLNITMDNTKIVHSSSSKPFTLTTTLTNSLTKINFTGYDPQPTNQPAIVVVAESWSGKKSIVTDAYTVIENNGVQHISFSVPDVPSLFSCKVFLNTNYTVSGAEDYGDLKEIMSDAFNMHITDATQSVVRYSSMDNNNTDTSQFQSYFKLPSSYTFMSVQAKLPGVLDDPAISCNYSYAGDVLPSGGNERIKYNALIPPGPWKIGIGGQYLFDLKVEPTVSTTVLAKDIESYTIQKLSLSMTASGENQEIRWDREPGQECIPISPSLTANGNMWLIFILVQTYTNTSNPDLHIETAYDQGNIGFYDDSGNKKFVKSKYDPQEPAFTQPLSKTFIDAILKKGTGAIPSGYVLKLQCVNACQILELHMILTEMAN